MINKLSLHHQVRLDRIGAYGLLVVFGVIGAVYLVGGLVAWLG